MRRLLLVLLLLALPITARPQGADSAAVARDAVSRLRSPYCPGLMLDVCPSPQAALLRDSIHAFAAQGASADELVEWMIARHGEEWRALPRKRGWGVWAWIAPPAVLLLGAALLVGRLRSARRDAVAAPEPTPLSGEERAELERALHGWHEGAER
jgi:cytochrome c-type biogenesis protein CcmH